MNNNETLDAFSTIVMKQLQEAEVEAAAAEMKMQEAEVAMKMARELVAERKMMMKKKGEQEKQRQQQKVQRQHRSQITTLLQRNSTSISSLQTLAIIETRYEENCRAIPEGDEDEDNNDADSIVKALATTSTIDLDENEKESNSKYCTSKIIKGGTQMEERGQEQRVVRAKSVIVAMSA